LARLSLTTLPIKVRLRDLLASVIYRSLFGGWFGALLFDKNGLGASNIAARNAQRGGVVDLLRGFLHTQAKVGFLQLFDFGLQAGNVFLAQISSFRHVDIS
jgi:hypothetical protein